MSKRKGLSLEEKRDKMVELLQESVCWYLFHGLPFVVLYCWVSGFFLPRGCATELSGSVGGLDLPF